MAGLIRVSMQQPDADHRGQNKMGITILLAKRSRKVSAQKILWCIFGIAVLLRFLSAMYQGNAVADLPGIYDQISYDGLARRVADGFGFSFAEGHWPATRGGEPTAHWSYLYTLYLTVIYRLIGNYPVIARIIQALIAGVIQTLLIWRIGTRLFSPTVGLIAAALSSIYIYFVYYAGALVTETLYITSILWMFDAAFRLTGLNSHSKPEVPGRLQWLEFGVAVGVTLLLRQVFLPFLPFIFLWVWWNLPEGSGIQWKRRIHWSAIQGLFLAGITLGSMILPFTIRNYRAFGTFVLLNTNAGFAFFWGNHPIHGTSFMSILPGGPTAYYDLIPHELLNLNEAQLDRALLERGVGFVIEDPKRYVLLSLSRLIDFIKFWPSSDSSLVSNISRVASFGVALPFILYGFWIETRRVWKTQSALERQAVILLIGFIAIYTLIHLASWTLIRYRLPVDAIFLIFAALGIDRLLKPHFFLAEVD